MATKYKITGLASLQRKLKLLPDKVKKEVIADIEDAADAIVMGAINGVSGLPGVPVDLGGLKQSIGNRPSDGGLNYSVFVDKEYAPYVEFGKGTGLDVPNELTEYALEFREGGNSNMKAQPFFFPAVFAEKEKLIKTVKKSIAKHLK